MSLLNIAGITDALATTAASTSAQPQQASLLSMLPMLVIFIVVFYFLLIRPQSKRAKEHRKLLEGLAKGDEVVTTGGLAGKIVKITDDFIVISIADNVEVTFQKAAIATVLPKGTLKAV